MAKPHGASPQRPAVTQNSEIFCSDLRLVSFSQASCLACEACQSFCAAWPSPAHICNTHKCNRIASVWSQLSGHRRQVGTPCFAGFFISASRVILGRRHCPRAFFVSNADFSVHDVRRSLPGTKASNGCQIGTAVLGSPSSCSSDLE